MDRRTVKDEPRDTPPMHELFVGRGHSHRNYEPEEFVEAVKNEDSLDEHEQIMQGFRRLDSGRFYDMVSEAHNVFGHLDLDGREQFSENHPNLMRWIRAWGYVEDMARYDDWVPEDDNE